MARILVTGGAGFLGINLCRFLLARGHEVVSLDIADFNYPERGQISEIRGDIRDRAAVDAAMAGADLSFTPPPPCPCTRQPRYERPTLTAHAT